MILVHDFLAGLHVYDYYGQAVWDWIGYQNGNVCFTFTPVRTCYTPIPRLRLVWQSPWFGLCVGALCNLSWAGMFCRPTGWKSAWNQSLNVPLTVIVSLHACWVSHVHTCSSRHKLTDEMGYGLQPAISLLTSEKVRNRLWIAVVFALHYSWGESNILCRFRKAIMVTSIFNLTALRLSPVA